MNLCKPFFHRDLNKAQLGSVNQFSVQTLMLWSIPQTNSNPNSCQDSGENPVQRGIKLPGVCFSKILAQQQSLLRGFFPQAYGIYLKTCQQHYCCQTSEILVLWVQSWLKSLLPFLLSPLRINSTKRSWPISHWRCMHSN